MYFNKINKKMGNQVNGYGYNHYNYIPYPNQVNYGMYQNPIMVNQNMANNVNIVFIIFSI